MRVVRNPLVFARLSGRPACIPNRRARGVKALGVRYENLVAKKMGWATQGQWFEFLDAEGKAWCQVDLMWEQEGLVVVGEVKYSWVPEAFDKLRWLYLPVVTKAMGKPAVGLVICKSLKPGVRHVYSRLDQALTLAVHSRNTIPTFHWIGQGTISCPFDRGAILTRRFQNGQAECREA